jgi:homeobox protein cut-like
MQTLQKQVSALSSDRDRLQKDNLELFGKIRYLQTYGQQGKSRSELEWDEEDRGGSNNHNNNEMSYRQVNTESVEIKYRSMYETRLNPFAQFSAGELKRKVGELNVADRLLLNTVTACVSSASGRLALLVYVALMHMLVFCTVYFAAHRVHHECPPCFHSADLLRAGAATPMRW